MKRKIATLLKQPWLYIVCAELLLIFIFAPLDSAPHLLFSFLSESQYDTWEEFAVIHMEECISIASLILFLISGSLMFLSLFSRNKIPGYQKAGRVMLYAVLTLVALVMGMPTQGRAREKARRISCYSNLQQIQYALREYAADYNSSLPPDLKTLSVTNYLTDEAIYRCPSCYRSHKEFSDYCYYGAGHKLNEKNPFVLIADHEKNHPGKYCNVIMSDGKLLKTRNKPGK